MCRQLPMAMRQNSIEQSRDDEGVGRFDHTHSEQGTVSSTAGDASLWLGSAGGPNVDSQHVVEMLRHIMPYLGPRDMGRVACTSRQGGVITEEDSVWKALCYRDFGILYRADRYFHRQ